MSATQDTLAAEVTELKAGMTSLHAGIADIQARQTAALAAAAANGVDPVALADLHAINDDLAGVVAALAPPPAPAAA
jgi:hypothetical protein